MRVTATLNEVQSKYVAGLAKIKGVSLSQAVQAIIEENLKTEAAKLKHRQATLHGIELVREYGTASGRPLGRPRAQIPIDAVKKLKAAGLSWQEVAKKLDLPVKTMRKYFYLDRDGLL